MNVTQFYRSLLFIWSVFFFFSCKHDTYDCTDRPVGNYSKGIFVVNEGGFNQSGTISWHDPVSGETVADVYGQANCDAQLGQFVQSLTFHNGKGYICVNGANKVIIVYAGTFQFLDSIPGLQLPRYFLALDQNFALISQWGADGLTGSVARVDLRTNTIVKTIPTGKGPDKMLRRPDNRLLVANSGGYGVDSTVSVINLNTDLEETRIILPGKNPSSLAVANFNGAPHYYVLCKGSYLDADPVGWIGSIDDLNGFDTGAYGEDLSATGSGDRLYWSEGGAIIRWDAGGITFFATQAAYGLSVQNSTGQVYCADARDFSSKGAVVVYDAAGQKGDSFEVGVAPGEIVIVE